MNKDQLSKLEAFLGKVQPGLIFSFIDIAKRVKVKYEPQDVQKDLRIVRQRLKEKGRSYLSAQEAIWRSD